MRGVTMKGSDLYRALRSPKAMIEFQMTGRVRAQQSRTKTNPLTLALQGIPPMYLSRIRGLTVDSRLGYTGRRQFNTASQALQWANPSHVAASHPADSWADRRFTRSIAIDDIIKCSVLTEERDGRLIALIRQSFNPIF